MMGFCRQWSPASIRRNGLTLIELIATLVLLSVFVTALFGLVPRFAKRATDYSGMNLATEAAWTRMLVERIAQDLGNADSVEREGNSMRMEGRLGRNRKDNVMTGAKDTVIYEWLPIDDRFAVFREQNARRELIACTSKELTIENASGTENEEITTLPDENSLAETVKVTLSQQLLISLRSLDSNDAAASLIVVRDPMEGAH